MSSIHNPSIAAGSSQQQNALSDAQFSSYVRKQSLNIQESLDAGLTIKTKEGDFVTLTSNSYAQLDSFQYNSKGVLETDTGTAMVSQNHREITLTTGESFSFSVVGDLSEDELEDIGAIVKGIDGIISEMAEGDMDDAVDKALSMGGYDTVSMYSADITYKKSYEMVSETSTQKAYLSPDQLDQSMYRPVDISEEIPTNKHQPGSFEAFPENFLPSKRKGNPLNNIEKIIEKMAKQLEKHEDNLVAKAMKPLDKLFNHHKRNEKNHHGKETSIHNAIENAQKEIEKMIEKMTSKMFKNYFSEFSV